ncbi:MAG TPA: glycosyltransferase [Elusimicrobiota bacterium]|nr:glycosyltransferase [Elusimicrobiota bacterium]
MTTPFLSVIIPVFNESDTIVPTLEKIIPYLQTMGQSFEIIVVNDGSIDQTSRRVRDFVQKGGPVRLVEYETNRGKGYAIHQGILHASESRFILFMDADYSTSIEQLAKFIPYFSGDVHVMIGTRTPHHLVDKTRPLLRRYSSGIFIWLCNNLLLLNPVVDLTCGFKCFEASSAKKLFGKMTIMGWVFDVEILFMAQLWGLKTVEIPVSWCHSNSSSVRLWSAPIASLIDLLRIKINHLRGRYSIP